MQQTKQLFFVDRDFKKLKKDSKYQNHFIHLLLISL